MGSEFNLTCASFKLFPGLSGYSTVTWIVPDDNPSIHVVSISTLDKGNVSVLRFNPLKSSHSRNYTCQASYFSPTGNISYYLEKTSIIAQSELYSHHFNSCFFIFFYILRFRKSFIILICSYVMKLD